MVIQNQNEQVSFIRHLCQSKWPDKSLPKWATDALSLPKKENPGKQIKQEIKTIQQLIFNNLPALGECLKDLKILNERLEKLKSSIKKSYQQEINQKIVELKLNSSFNVETVLDQLNYSIQKKDDSKALRCYHFIFNGGQLETILSYQGTKYPSLVIEILKRAIYHANYDEIKICLKFIQDNQLHEHLKGMLELEKLFNIQEMADFTLVVSDESDHETKIYVNSAVLAMRCSYFSRYFGGYWGSRSKESVTKEMTITGRIDSLKELVQYFYTQKITLTNENIEDIMQKACEWDLNEVTQLCENWYITTFSMNSEDILKIYQSDDAIYSETGIINELAQNKLLNNLTSASYEEIYGLVEKKNDVVLQEKILNCLANWLLATLSKDRYVRSFALKSKDEQSIFRFLQEKGHLLKKLECFNIRPYTTSLICLKTIVELFPNLASLDLNEKWRVLSLVEMQELIKLKGLKELRFKGCSDFRGLMDLASFTKMEVLIINEQNFHPEMEGVEELYQSLKAEEKINDDASSQSFARTSLSCLLSEMANLIKLDLSFCKGVHYVLPALKHNPDIKELVLTSSDLNDSSAEDIAKILSLEKLDMSDCEKTTDLFLKKICKSLSCLKELDIGGSMKGKNIILGESLKKFPFLKKLSLESSHHIKGTHQLIGIEEILTLKELSLKGDAIIDSISPLLENLLVIQKLSINGRVSDKLIEIISKLPILHQLKIQTSELNTPTPESWQFFSKMRNLQTLTLEITSRSFFEQEFFEHLTNLKNLKSIRLTSSDKAPVVKPVVGTFAMMTALEEVYIDGIKQQ